MGERGGVKGEAPPRISQPGPLSRAEPLQEWQIDFKTVSTVKPEAGTGKQVNVVETFNMIDTGTSIWLAHPSRLDFNAETTLLEMVEALRTWGVPAKIGLDRDPRFVTSWRADLFSSPLVRLLLNLDIEVDIHPPSALAQCLCRALQPHL